MNATTQAADVSVEAPATRPFYWLVRRELWEHRSLIMTPLIVAGVILFGFILNVVQLPRGVRMITELDPERQREVVYGFYGLIAAVIAIAMMAVAWFYALDALYNERRDRSILFWKSLPVSDTATVLSKLFVLGVGVPAITFAVALALQILVLLISTVTLLAAGESAAPLWANLPPAHAGLLLLYVLAVQSLWYAPVYGWLLLVSAWSRRAPFLWSVLPPLAVVLFERIAFDTGYFGQVLGRQLTGGLRALGGRFPEVRISDSGLEAMSRSWQVAADGLAEPQVWIGLAVAAGLVAATVWMRRYREPI